MELVINIALVMLAVMGALTAIGGETWRQNESHFSRKITLRGWFAIACLFFTLILGVIKEIRSNAASERAEHAQARLRNELQATNQKLEIANQQLQEMKDLIAKLGTSLSDMTIEIQYLVLLSTITGFTPSAGGETIETKLLSAQQDLYNAKYQLAQQKFVAIAKEYPSHPAGHFFQAMTNLWQLGFTPDNTGLINSSLALLKTAQNLAERALKVNKQESEMFFWRGISSGVIAICETLLESAPEQRNPSLLSSEIDQLKILDLLQSPLNDLQQSLKNNPEFTDAQIGLALFELYLGDGNQQKGVKQLWSVIDKGKYIKVEASYLLIDFLFGQGTDKDLLYHAIPTSLGLSMQYSDNLLFSLARAKLYYVVINFHEAKAILTEILNGNNKPYQNYIIDEARYYLGTIAFNQENYLLGIEHYNSILAAKPKLPSYVLPWTYFRSAQCYWRLGNTSKARDMLDHTLKTENVNNVHNEANRLLKILSKN